MVSQRMERTPSFRPENDRPVPQDLFVCPVCKGGLRNADVDAIVCTICGLRFRQASKDYVNLLPDDLWQPHADCWSERQHEMEEWYRELIAEPIAARDILIEHDYKPYARVLATFSGTVLDLGGGAGFTRQFLGADVRYIVADPSLDWLAPDWQRIAEPGFASGETPSFVRAVGEHLPFPDQMFDAVLALWSLNHVREPEAVFREVHRALKPAGRFLAVLEDMEPSWRDLWGGAVRRLARYGTRVTTTAHPHPFTRRLLKAKLGRNLLLHKWPVQTDHIRIQDSEISKWSAGYFKFRRREWIGNYLAYQFERA
jgi:ubiquinone/menaquinone biosynthesis C-methylase UbiE